MVLVPMYGLMNGWGPGDSSVEQFKGILGNTNQVCWRRRNGSGRAYTLLSMRKYSLPASPKPSNPTADDENLLRTEIDLPMRFVFIFCSIIVGMTLLFYWWKTGSLILSIAELLSWRLPCSSLPQLQCHRRCSWFVKFSGFRNDTTPLFTVALVCITKYLMLGLSTPTLMLATMLIASIVASSAAVNCRRCHRI